MRLLLLHLLFAVVFSSMCWSEEGHHNHSLTDEELGAVHFSTSCSKQLEPVFDGAVALLHSFQYEQAAQVFTEISKQDDKCAMAWWGIAMSHYHGLWDDGDTSAGRAALYKAQEIAAANRQTTPREKAYLDALSEIYRDDGRTVQDHACAFEQKMGALRSAYPRDNEAAIFYALALAISAPKTDKTFGHQRKCGEILEPIFEHQHRHPG